VNGRGKICGGEPADSKPLVGLSPEQAKAYQETGYVFSGASSKIALSFNFPWNAFTMPHFTAGLIDWDNSHTKDKIEQTKKEIVLSMREASKLIDISELIFSKLVVFKVRSGGVCIPSQEGILYSVSI